MNQSDPSQNDGEASVIVLLPTDDDPTREIASGDHPHVTLVYMGDGETDIDKVKEIVGELAKTGYQFPPAFDRIAGEGMLGQENAQVYFLDGVFSGEVRDMLVGAPYIQEQMDKVEQFPNWTPHITVGYPDAPAAKVEHRPDGVVFDRLAIFSGGEVTEFPLNFDEPEGEDQITASSAVEGEVYDEPGEDLQAAVAELQDLDPDFQVPWHGILAPENVPSSDKRMFLNDSLTARDLPLPLRWVPADVGKHDGAIIVGRIDRIFRKDGMIWGEGVFDTSNAAYEAVRMLANRMLRGVSVDVSDVVLAKTNDEELTAFQAAELAAVTLVAIPAFAGAYVNIGPYDDDAPDETQVEPETFAVDKLLPKHMDGPGWITQPKPTKRITSYWVDGRGAAKINWGPPGDFNRCRRQLGKYVQNPAWLNGLCANLHHRATGAWPGRLPGQKADAQTITASAAPSVNIVASITDGHLPAAWFQDPKLESPTPLTVTEEGRVFGHLATFDTCHIGYDQVCTTAPRSSTSYAYFATGEVETDEGTVPVGQIVLGGPHADPRARMQAAFVHYAATSSALADIAIGEDNIGIWFSGAVREGVSPKELRTLRASSLSGDWRRVQAGGRANLELVAALAVNNPGFPIPRTSLAASGERQLSLVAASPVVQADQVETFAELNKARAKFRGARAAMLKESFAAKIGD